MARSGSNHKGGRPKGSLSKTTLDKIKVEKEMRQRIMRNVTPLLDAQMSIAKGESYLMRIDETGEGKQKRKEHVLVTNPVEIKEALDSMEFGENGENGYYYITTKSPDHKAIENLLDRAFGKPAQSMDISGSIKFKPTPILSKIKHVQPDDSTSKDSGAK